jgi:hypothetical protein
MLQDEPFHLLRPNSRLVEAWSKERLKFEPKDWMQDFRDALRLAVRDLDAGRDEGIAGLYQSSQTGLCDVENILIYNVGPSSFKKAAHTKLSFERSFEDAPHLAPHLLHYQRYELAGLGSGSDNWTRGRTWAEWTGVIPRPSSDTKVAALWWAIETAEQQTFVGTPQAGPFGIRILLSSPYATALNLAEIVKPLTDAAIAAFQSHAEGDDVPELAGRISEKVGAPPHEVAMALCSPDAAVISGERIVWPRAGGVQWNPADDRCVSAEISVTESTDHSWEIAGEIFAVDPRMS